MNGDDEPSEYHRLFYPFLFEGGHSELSDVLKHVRESTVEKARQTVRLRQAMLKYSRADLIGAGLAMTRAFADGGTLFAFGNGGSTTDAQDLVSDLVNPPVSGWKSLPALSLASDMAVVTAVGNDVGFDNIFARQIIAFGQAGDIAFGISTSGNSRNVVAGLEQARRQGMVTIGVTGYDGGNTRSSAAVDYCIVAPGDYIPRIQEAQATAYHALLEIVQHALNS